MRLQLMLLALATFALFLVFARTAHAQSLAKIDSRSGVYQDTDRTTILTTNIAARGQSGRFGVTARHLVDVISSASVDVVTAATGRFHETRHETEGGLMYKDDVRTATAAYIYSTENDWTSSTGVASLLWDVDRHNATIKLAGTYVTNDVGRSGDATFRRKLTVAGGTAGVTIVASPRDLVDLGYTLSLLDGYQASPYRFVAFRSATGLGLAPTVPENDPNTRVRHAVTLRYNRHLFTDSALRSHARGYLDDWGIASVTAGTEYVIGFGAWETAAFVRGYAQQHATFYKATYDTAAQYMTADRELATFVDAFAGARVGWRKPKLGILDELRFEVKGSGFVFKFFDFPRLQLRSGVIAEIAMGVAF